MEPGVKVYVHGLSELNHKLDRIERDVIPELRRATDEAVHMVHGRVPPYPEASPLSDYERTGTLGREITTDVQVLGQEVVGSIGTVTIYAPWVISDEPTPDGRGPQAWMHRGRWWTLQGVVRDARKDIIEIYRRAVDSLLKRE